MFNEYIDGDYIVREYESGTIVRTLISNTVSEQGAEENVIPTLEDKINYLFYKSMGVI